MKYALITVIILAVVLIAWKVFMGKGTVYDSVPAGPENPPESISIDQQEQQMQTFDKREQPVTPGERPVQN